MKKYALVTIFILFFNWIFSQNNKTISIEEIAKTESKSFHKNNGLKGVPQAGNYDLKYHRLEWEIDPNVYYIKGSVTSYFVPVTSGFNEIYFDFSNALSIDSIIYNGSSLAYTQPINNILQITLPITLNQNVLDSITVHYQGVPIASSGFGSFIQSSHNGDSIIWTLSEPYGALDWWPCKQDLNDKIDSIDIFVKTPKKNRVGSQGLLVNETTVGLNKIYHWKHRYPIAAYLISVAVTNYAAYTDVAALSTGNLNILNYVYPEDSAVLVTQSPAIIPIMQLFDTLYGIYPFMDEKYGHAQFGWGGGMEHQTMSSMVNFSFNLMAHELAHQWFGDKITCGNWHEIWLNEGFATYLTGISIRELNPVDWRLWRESNLNSIVSQPDGSVYNPDTTNVSRIFNGRLTYRKGAYLLRMLEWKLGEAAFNQGVKNYLIDANYAYNYAVTDNLKAHLELSSGLNLTEYFNDWFYGEGYPSYQVNWNQNGNTVDFVVNQSQSHNSVSFFEMPIPIYVKGQNIGEDTTLVFEHTFSGESFSASIPFVVDSVFFDPELWLISANSIISSVESLNGKEPKITIYPNPTTTSFTIINHDIAELKKLRMYDVLGNTINLFIESESTREIKIDATLLPQGTYIIELQFGTYIIRKKINKI
jgi:aminopeptidase N